MLADIVVFATDGDGVGDEEVYLEQENYAAEPGRPVSVKSSSDYARCLLRSRLTSRKR